MARNVGEEHEYYRSSTRKGGAIPVRWTAPEALEERLFTEQSDVWSFGITVYEVHTRGQTPYASWNNQKVWTSVKAGHRLSRPPGCTPDVYNRLLVRCWREDPSRRPLFRDIVCTVNRLLKTHATTHIQRSVSQHQRGGAVGNAPESPGGSPLVSARQPSTSGGPNHPAGHPRSSPVPPDDAGRERSPDDEKAASNLSQ